MLSQLWAPFRTARRPSRRGGFRQQAAREDEDAAASAAAAPPSISKLIGRQLLKWVSGDISAKAMKEVADDAKSDGFSHPMIERVAALRGDNHAHQDLMDMFNHQTQALDMIEGMPGPNTAITDILKPSKVIAAIHQHYPDKLKTKIGADPAKLKTF